MAGQSQAVKDVKISFQADIGKLSKEIKDMAAIFSVQFDNMIAKSNTLSKTMTDNVIKMRGEIQTMSHNTQAMTQSMESLRQSSVAGFLGMQNQLAKNNTEILQMVKNLAALHQQTKAISNSKKGGPDDGGPFDLSSLTKSFVVLKGMNMAWNAMISGIRSARDELIEFDKITKTIVTMSGEKLIDVQSKIFSLSSSSGKGINEIAKAIQDSTNEGNTLAQSFQKINNAIILSNKNMGSLANSIARIDDIVDQFGITADKAFGIVMGKNLSSERALAVFGRLAKDAKEAGFEVDTFSSILNIMANRAGIAERQLQVGFRAVLNGLQEVGAVGQKTFIEQILPNWNTLSEATKRHVELQLGLRQNDEFLRVLGERWGEIGRDIKNYNDLEASIIARSKLLPETLAMKLNEAWNATLIIGKSVLDQLEHYLNTSSKVKAVLDYIIGQGRLLSTENTPEVFIAQSNALETKIKSVEAHLNIVRNFNRNNLENLRTDAKYNELTQQRLDLLKQQSELNNRFQQSVVSTRIDFSKLNAQISATVSTMEKFQSKKATSNIDFDRFSSQKDFKKSAQDEFGDQNNLIGAQVKAIKISSKKAAFEAEVALQGRHLQLLNERKAKMLTIYNDAQFAEELDEERIKTIQKMETALFNYNKEAEKTNKDESRAAAKEERDIQKENLEIYQRLRKEIINKRTEGEISATQEVNQLKMIVGWLENTKNADLNLVKAKGERDRIEKQNREEVEKIIKTTDELINKEKFQDQMEEIRYQEKAMRLKRHGELTRADKVKLIQDEIAMVKAQINNEELMNRDSIMKIYNEKVAMLMAERQLLQGSSDQKQAEFTKRLQEITTEKDQRIAMTNVLIDLELKLQEARTKSFDIEKEAAHSFATHSLELINTAITKVISNTGDLTHAWRKFAEDFMADIAKMLVKQQLFNMAKGALSGGFIGGSLFGAVKSVLGFSEGSGIRGVPGYASGTSLMGADTVPAMLSPGEIVLDRNASDVFRTMSRGMGNGGMTIVIQNYPSLLGSREEIIQLDNALNNPSVRTSIDRRKV